MQIKKHSEKSKSRIASQLRAHVAMSRQTGSDGEDEGEVRLLNCLDHVAVYIFYILDEEYCFVRTYA